eukprot:389321-Prorocentrum_minimum.AAC.1
MQRGAGVWGAGGPGHNSRVWYRLPVPGDRYAGVVGLRLGTVPSGRVRRRACLRSEAAWSAKSEHPEAASDDNGPPRQGRRGRAVSDGCLHACALPQVQTGEMGVFGFVALEETG